MRSTETAFTDERFRDRGDQRPALLIVLLAIGALIVMPAVVYAAFIMVDTGSGYPFKNVSSSMSPTVLNGDYITARRIGSATDAKSALHRGDLVVLAFPPDPRKQFIKRLVGRPGDTLSMVNGTLFLDGRSVAEPYAHRDEPTIDPVSDDFVWQRRYVIGEAAAHPAKYVASRNNWGPLVVPKASFFVLGDNRDNSLDSRYFGFVHESQLQARVRRVYFSRDSTGTIRWSRIGMRLQ